jgi:hypothetical protein
MYVVKFNLCSKIVDWIARVLTCNSKVASSILARGGEIFSKLIDMSFGLQYIIKSRANLAGWQESRPAGIRKIVSSNLDNPYLLLIA